jgi:hypothetical protein
MTLPLTLVVKLASVAVHAQEMLSPDGHEFDGVALERVANDPEVAAWLKTLGPLAPVKRNAR